MHPIKSYLWHEVLSVLFNVDRKYFFYRSFTQHLYFRQLLNTRRQMHLGWYQNLLNWIVIWNGSWCQHWNANWMQSFLCAVLHSGLICGHGNREITVQHSSGCEHFEHFWQFNVHIKDLLKCYQMEFQTIVKSLSCLPGLLFKTITKALFKFWVEFRL